MIAVGMILDQIGGVVRTTGVPEYRGTESP
jgi:hypothetical protein